MKERVAVTFAAAVVLVACSALCGSPDGESLNGIGERYFNGIGVKRDYQKAADWFRKGAEKGDAKAMLNLGLCYNRGFGVQMDKREAVRWCRKSVEAGYDEAMFTLGWCYDRGLGVERDEQEAKKWYHRAAALGNASAQSMLNRELRGKRRANRHGRKGENSFEEFVRSLVGKAVAQKTDIVPWLLFLFVAVGMTLVVIGLLLLGLTRRLIGWIRRLRCAGKGESRWEQAAEDVCSRADCFKPGDFTFGMCEICGHAAELTCREMPMFRDRGRHEPAEEKSFRYLSCGDCERRMFPAARNRNIALILGVFAVVYPISCLPSVDWLVRSYLGQWVVAAQWTALILPVLLLESLEKTRARHFSGIARFRLLWGRKFRLGYGGLAKSSCVLFASACASTLCVFLALCGLCRWQGGWTASRGVVKSSEVRSTFHGREKSRRASCRLAVKYRYGYEVNGETFSGTGYGILEAPGRRLPENPWKAGESVPIVYDASCPGRSVSEKVKPLEFGKKALNALLLLGMICGGLALSGREKSANRQHCRCCTPSKRAGL